MKLNVNLGCGPSGIDTWTNLDWGILPFLSKFPYLRVIFVKLGLLTPNYITKWPRIRLFDIRRRLPFGDRIVDNIYCSHVLEHFDKWQAEEILAECHRVLKDNGKIRIVLPNLKTMITNYKNSADFCREFYGFNKDVKTIGSMFIRGHQWMYDEISAVELLSNSNFKNVRVCKRAEGNVPDIKMLDVKINEPLSVYLEAEKKL